ncbi:ATP-dependent helicase [Pseudoflavitalea sp. X16]|uniref:UvrD-helicase domain-containing protein n=1 Tax=Paraflavitalea devenefica TaxID=2716334 RepID=UPI00141DFA55|nr:ATP-dependent helicase [Paraflavitalea devenefica]NII26178.1 ATP-dependent helicase [Paraflavitalea devenefica]
MKKIAPQEWVPADGLHLEDNAREAVTAPGHVLVVAGPGSGKTELLAQKAGFLLQTGACPYPRRILALSFKRDAAANIRERVKKRCGQELSKRFDAFTFDGFAKQLLDRFRLGIPTPYQPAAGYAIMGRPRVEIAEAFRAVDNHYFQTNTHDYNTYLTSVPLPYDVTQPAMAVMRAAWLRLSGAQKPMLSFAMIMRLAEYMMVANPKVKAHLQQTYSHVFLDEFQDTTFVQYDFLKTGFAGSYTYYTAVGDDKQTIMGWAGAMTDIFSVFEKDTQAKRIPLRTNFRSAPRLVAFQNHLVKELLHKTDFAVPSERWKPDQGEARMCFFASQSEEMGYLLKQVQGWLEQGLVPRDICILVKQLPENYTKDLIGLLAASGIKARDESSLQDLLTEEVTIFMTAILRVIFSGKFGPESEQAFHFLAGINASLEDSALVRLKRQYLAFCKKMQAQYSAATLTPESILSVFKQILQFAGVARIKSTYPQYAQGSWLKELLNTLLHYLRDRFSESGSMLVALDTLIGADTIPVMTTHKSKGLEYHTVIFIGLEDAAFWTYHDNAVQDNNLVFVALSRARERVLFTFCEKRSFDSRKQKSDNIQVIHDIIMGFNDTVVVDFRGSAKT